MGTEVYTDSKKLNDLTKLFFGNFVKTTIDSTLIVANGLLENFSNNYKNTTNVSITSANSVKKYEDDIKKQTYYNIKSLYDKFGGANSEQSSSYSQEFGNNGLQMDTSYENIDLFYNSLFGDDECLSSTKKSSYDLYQIFSVVDRGNNDIGTKVLADLTYLYKNLYVDFSNKSISNDEEEMVKAMSNLTKGSFQGILSGLASQNGFLFQQIPNYLNLNGVVNKITTDTKRDEIVNGLFGIHQNTELLGVDINGKNFGGLYGVPGYIFQLGSITSKTDEVNIRNNYLNSFCLDVGTDKNGEITTLTENAPEEIVNSNITCFTVDFGNQNQQMFNNIQLDTSEFFDTEESIKTWVGLVNNSDKAVQTSNLFPVLEKRSYSCTISSMGNATIQPLSYFYLRNTPLFLGTYWITNVSHKLQPNTMSTTFKGVRQPIISKNDVRQTLISLMRNKADEIAKVAAESTSVSQLSFESTIGTISIISTSDTPFPAVKQTIVDSSRTQTFEGKNIIGSFIYSVSGNNDASVANMGIISSLYNTSKAFYKTTDHVTIISGMVNVALGFMQYNAFQYRDVRYDGGGGNFSLSTLFSTSSFSENTKLGELLDEICKSSVDYNNNLVTPTSTKVFGVTVNTGQLTLEKSGMDVALSPGQEINVLPANIDIKSANIFIDSKVKNKASNTYPISSSITLYDLLTNLGDGKIISDVNIEKSINDKSIKFIGQYDGILLFSAKEKGFYSSFTVNDEFSKYYSYNTVSDEVTSDIETNYKINTDTLSRYDQVDKKEPGFKDKVKSVAMAIGANELDLVQIMYKESGINQSIKNSIGCVGLIQFCPDCASCGYKKIGKITYDMNTLKNMTAIEQMDVVKEYFISLGKFGPDKKSNIGDLYTATFYPYAIGKSADFVLGSENTNIRWKFLIAEQNPGIAKFSTKYIDNKKVITLDSVIKYVIS